MVFFPYGVISFEMATNDQIWICNILRDNITCESDWSTAEDCYLAFH